MIDGLKISQLTYATIQHAQMYLAEARDKID